MGETGARAERETLRWREDRRTSDPTFCMGQCRQLHRTVADPVQMSPGNDPCVVFHFKRIVSQTELSAEIWQWGHTTTSLEKQKAQCWHRFMSRCSSAVRLEAGK